MSHTEAFRSFERGTPAGNKLFHLYNKKSMDSTLDPELLKRLQQMRKEQDAAAAPKQKVVPKSKVHVNVPRQGVRPAPTSEQIAEYRLSNIQKRKSANTITAENRAIGLPEAPEPKRPLITDKDKERLQLRFQFGQDLPEVDANRISNLAAAKQRSETDSLLDRFGELQKEIEERKQYLADMKDAAAVVGPSGTRMQLGGATAADRRSTEARLMNEVADRIAEMKKIDDRLRHLQDSQR